MIENPIILNNMEKALIMGTVLGDGTMQKRGNSYRLRIAHGIKQKAYVKWKRLKLAKICETTQEPVIRTDKKGCETMEFYTSSGKYLEEIFHLFYKKNGKYRKSITSELIENLPMDPMVLAVFFMDDGSVRNDCYAGKLATQSFTEGEHILLQFYFEKWNIKSTVDYHSKEKNQFYLSIPVEGFKDLVKIIEPIVREIPEMCYKLNDQCKPRND